MENELQPHLEQAQQALAAALDEACGVKLKDANTGELIRIEETLAAATQAAKKVVSIRLRRRKQLATRETTESATVAGPPADMLRAVSQRVFDEVLGKRWRVYAVHPSMSTLDRAALPETYREGWLSFESGDEKRRVAPIPDAWEDLSIDELRLLVVRAQRVPKRPSNPITPPSPQ